MESINLEHFKKALEFLPDAIIIYSPQGAPLFSNPIAQSLLGESAQSTIASLLTDHIDLNKFIGQTDETSFYLRLEMNSQPMKALLKVDHNKYFYLTIKQLEKEQKLAEALKNANEQIKQLDDAINGANIGCWDFFPQQNKIVANKTWVTQKHYLDEDFRKEDSLFAEVIDGLDKWSEMVHPEDLTPTLEIIKAHLDGKTETYDAKFRMICGDGKWRWIHDRGQVFERDESGNAIRMNGVHIDITEAKELEHQIEHLLRTDSLTSVMSRRYFETHASKSIVEGRRNNNFLAFLLLDLDYFKQFNDTYGHLEGDQCLQKIGKVINDSLQRKGDACFRLGGEEFAIIFQVNSKQTAEDFAKTIKDKIESLRIPHRHNTASPYLTISIGLWCDKPNADINVNEMYRLADSLLYQSKSNGRNQIMMS